MPRISCLYSPVKTSAVHNVTCLYGPADNVQNEATIFTARKKYFYSCSSTPLLVMHIFIPCTVLSEIGAEALSSFASVDLRCLS